MPIIRFADGTKGWVTEEDFEQYFLEEQRELQEVIDRTDSSEPIAGKYRLRIKLK